MHYCDCKGTTKLQLLQRVFQRMLTFTLVYQLVNVLTGASHEDGSLGECEILLAGDVYNWLDCLKKVLLPLLALSLCSLSTMF